MYRRQLEHELLSAAKGYPIVTVTGPRQSGKTTLVRLTFPNKPYVDLEAPDINELALSDPRRFLAQYEDGAILDEIQYAPKLLSYLKIIVDERNTTGMFVLTGSHQLELHQAVSQSLAGRTALLTLLPMSLAELFDADIDVSLDQTLLMGGYPRLYQQQLEPTKCYRDYFQTYLERDVRQLINVKDLVQFRRFIRLCAGRIGQLLNLQGLSNDAGVSTHTVKHWISILEASFILVRLQPYHNNFGKRLIKSPKLYFTDVGLASYLLGIHDTTQMARDPLRGSLVENLVLLELMKHRLNQGLDPQLYFYRDTRGHEVDLIFQSGRDLIPIEVKAAQTYSKDYLKSLRSFRDLAGQHCRGGYLIYAGLSQQAIGDFHLINYRNAPRALQE